MNPSDVLSVLHLRDFAHLYHANSVLTSCTFLREGALVSRGYAEELRLPQTPQYTDDIDKRYGIWHDVFVDSDDYHRRIKDRNQYGPVAFVFSNDILANLPAGSEVFVTRFNPTKWASVAIENRYFRRLDELRNELSRGTFDHMVTIRTRSNLVPFGNSLLEVRLDNPQAQRDGANVFATSLAALRAAAAEGCVGTPIIQQTCRDGCKCIATYRARPELLHAYF